nr:MAG TPA: hypothetical protein [Caudoviricetes sp.]
MIRFYLDTIDIIVALPSPIAPIINDWFERGDSMSVCVYRLTP